MVGDLLSMNQFFETLAVCRLVKKQGLQSLHGARKEFI